MKKLGLIFLGMLTAGIMQAQTFKVDGAHSAVGFKIKHLMISNVPGVFKSFTGSWTYDAEKKTITAFEMSVDVTTVDTNIEKRDKHLQDAEFFDTKNHPKMTFVMSSYKDGKMTGKMTIKGITKDVTLDATVSKVVANPWNKEKKKQGLEIKGIIKRLDFKVGEKSDGKSLGEDVSIELNLEGDSQ